MLISSKGQYALRLMVDISINSGSTVTVKNGTKSPEQETYEPGTKVTITE